MELSDLLVPTYRGMLGNLSVWLDKAGDVGDGVLATRLAPDMFPLATQVRFACVQAIEGTARLSGIPFPPLHQELLDEGRSGGESPGTLAEAKARITQTLEWIARQNGEALDPASAMPHELPIGMTFDFSAGEYARDWALGQFYFHLMAAYSNLRHAGIPLGKGDYVAHLLPKARPTGQVGN